MSKEQLIKQDSPSNDNKPAGDDLTFMKALRTVSGLTINPIIGSFFHPIYLIINASTLGHANEP